jgi:hypothetical protein
MTRPARCTEHRAGYRKGCPACKTWASWYQRYRSSQIRDGVWEPMVDAEPVRAYVRGLLAAGMLLADIADVAGLTLGALTKIMYYRGCTKLTSTIANALLGVKFKESERYLIDPTGTRRRLEALAALGWTFGDLAQRFGVDTTTPRKWCVHPLVARTTAERVKQLYRDLAATPGPSERARRRAVRKGWAPPAAWDDIDDPNAKPDLGGEPDPDYVDEVKVQRALRGFRTDLSDAELVATVRAGTARGTSLTGMCDRLSVNRTRVSKLLAEAAARESQADGEAEAA